MYSIPQNLVTGSATVWATAVQLTTLATACTRIYVKAASTNTVSIFVWPSTITAWTTDATDWFELAPSEWQYIEIWDASKVYAIAWIAGQKVYFAVTY